MSINDEFPDDDRPKRRRFDGNDGAEYDDVSDSPRRGGRMEIARSKVSTPGMILMVLGFISIVITVAYVAILWISPDLVLESNYAFMKDLMKNNPQGMPPYEEYKKDQQVQSSVVGILQLIGGVLMAVGGMGMRQLKGFGLAMAGSIMATIPLCTNQCCCLSLPFGIWGIIVLMNEDVKWGFRRTAEAGGPRD